MARIEKTYASFPAYLHFRHADLGVVPDTTFWRRLTVRLVMLEHRLLLERLGHKHGILSGQSMVDCAREMLELTVLLWVQRDRFPEWHHDYDWMLMCWGIPSSGVLCVALLKEIQEREPERQHGKPTRLRLPRSEIVQNLSLLIGFLEWIKPAAGNYQLCSRMRIIIKRILDQILNPSPVSSTHGGGAEGARDSGDGNSEEKGPLPMTTTTTTTTTTTATTTMHIHGAPVALPTPGPQASEPDAGTDHHAPGMPPPPPPPDDATLFEGGSYGHMMGELDNFDWLNNVDWSRGPWYDLGQDVSGVRWS
jgi:hypothetical protein